MLQVSTLLISGKGEKLLVAVLNLKVAPPGVSNLIRVSLPWYISMVMFYGIVQKLFHCRWRNNRFNTPTCQ